MEASSDADGSGAQALVQVAIANRPGLSVGERPGAPVAAHFTASGSFVRRYPRLRNRSSSPSSIANRLSASGIALSTRSRSCPSSL